MAVTLSARLASLSLSGSLTSATLAAVTVPAGDVIVVAWGVTRSASGSSDWGPGVAVTDSAGLAWDVRVVCSYALPVGAWDVAVVVACAVSGGSATAVTVTPGVDCYVIQGQAWGASECSGLEPGQAGQAALADGPLSLTLPAVPPSDGRRLVARYWSAGGGSPTTPTLSMAAGWTEAGEVYSPGDYAGSTAVWDAPGGSSSVEVLDTWTGGGSTYGGALIAVALSAPAPAPVEDTMSQSPERSSAVIVDIPLGSTYDVMGQHGRPAVAVCGVMALSTVRVIATMLGASETVAADVSSVAVLAGPVVAVQVAGVTPTVRVCLWFD